ncbi:MAG TPA: proline dehydrogenase family protein [Dehalococcoidia bacterium]|nr:proline dehydrogenase family protein [Dehalococcoidia bacterium]
MLRQPILLLSRSRTAEHLATNLPGLRRVARRFVAGQSRADALAAVRRLNAAGLEATVSFLGEAVTSEAEVRAAVAEFTSFARAAQAQGLRSHLSIKLTELGLAFDPALAARTLDEVLGAAADAGTFVRIDMEDSRYTQRTLDVFREARARHENVGVVIQAYLRRSEADMRALAREGASVRLVKGAYREPERIAFAAKREVDAAFVRLADLYFAEMQPGARLAVATHDARMVRAALNAARARGVPRDAFEFQMLYGIRADLQRRLRDLGHTVRVYVPYGSHWYPYLMRRLAERPANLWFFLRAATRR